jgi:hypothetical protein
VRILESCPNGNSASSVSRKGCIKTRSIFSQSTSILTLFSALPKKTRYWYVSHINKKKDIKAFITLGPVKYIFSIQIHIVKFSTYWLHGAEYYSRGHQLCSHLRTFQHFMEPESSLPHSQQPYNSPYPESDQSSPHPPILTSPRSI